MGYMRHDSVIVVVSDYAYDRPDMPDIDAFRASLPKEWQALVVGPVEAVVNGYKTYAFLPDGSKERWGTSDEGDEYRRAFIDLFSVGHEDKSSPFDVTVVSHGGDEPDETRAQHLDPTRVFAEVTGKRGVEWGAVKDDRAEHEA